MALRNEVQQACLYLQCMLPDGALTSMRILYIKARVVTGQTYLTFTCDPMLPTEACVGNFGGKLS